LIALGVHVGLADLLPDRLRVEYDAGADPTDIEAHLSSVLGQRVYVSLHISPPRAVRKPVLQVLDERGTTIAFAKLGVDDFTSKLVRAEADSVSFLAATEWTAFRVPTVLYTGSWNGAEVLVQTAFRQGRDAEPTSADLRLAMDELARARGVVAAPLASSAYWYRLAERVESLPRTDFSRLIERSLHDMEKSGGDVVLEYGSWHGDWAPWNMVVTDGQVMVWDWEKFETGVPIGFDAVHYYVQGAVVMAASPPARAFRNALDDSRALLLPFGVTADAALLVVWLYAVDIAVRYLEDREMEAGATPMSRLRTWLPQVLDAAAHAMS
jgi:hypothetical protein